MKRKKDSILEGLFKFLALIFILFIVGVFLKFKEQIELYGRFFVVFVLTIVFIGIILYIFILIKKKKKSFNFDDDKKYLYLLKRMSPNEFENEIASMFSRHGYKARAVGKSHDGGIDIEVSRDGKKYLAQCKKHLSSKAGVIDVRSFYGVMTRRNADGGFFITTNEFTEEVWDEFKNDNKIKLIDKNELVKFYKKSLKK